MKIIIYGVISGQISNLQTQAMHAQYLKNIKAQQQTAGAVAITQAVLGDAGAIFSAQAATDDGDPVEGFVMQVSDQIVIGSFWKATFQDGDSVQVVGYKKNNFFQALAVTKPSERIIWMMPHCERGTQSKKYHLIRMSGYFITFCLCAEILLMLFSSPPFWPMLLGLSLGAIVILFVTVGMSWGDFMSFSREMNAVGIALGLPEPEKIDLFKSTSLARKEGKPDLPMGVYYY